MSQESRESCRHHHRPLKGHTREPTQPLSYSELIENKKNVVTNAYGKQKRMLSSSPGERQTPVGLWKVGMRYSKAQNGLLAVGFHLSRLAELAFNIFSSSSGLIPSLSISTTHQWKAPVSTNHQKCLSGLA